MSIYTNYNDEPARVIGGFHVDKNEDYKDGIKVVLESMIGQHGLNPFTNINNILQHEPTKAAYKQALIGDILQEGAGDAYYAAHSEKLEQLFENSSLDILTEASTVANLDPIVGASLPILKKNYVKTILKDIMITEIPTKPIVKRTFRRKFLKDGLGNKHYIPDIFYDDSYKAIIKHTRGTELPDKFFPETGDLPVHEFDLLAAAGGSLEKRDSIALDVEIDKVQFELSTGDIREIELQGVQADLATGGTFSKKVEIEGEMDILMGTFDFYAGKVTVMSSTKKIKKVHFKGHLNNEMNDTDLEVDMEQEHKTWTIGNGDRLNTGYTVEKIKDYKALLDVDLATETVSDMADVLTHLEDSNGLDFVRQSFGRWAAKAQLPFGYKEGFTAKSIFSCEPTNTTVPRSVWLNTELKFALNILVNELKIKLREKDIMFVVAGHPNNVSLLGDNVRWIANKDTKMGGITYDYAFGALTQSEDRISVVSSMKIQADEGLWVIAYPLTEETYTFKHMKYSMNIENSYRNSRTPNTPNIMALNRHLTTELLPVQGRLELTNNAFGIVR